MADLTTNVRYIKGIGEQRAKSLEKLGIATLRDLISWFPRKYDDRRQAKRIADLIPGETACVAAMIASPPTVAHIRKGMDLIKVRTVDNAARSEILQIASVFRTSIIDVSVDTLTLAVIGDEGKVDAMQKMLEMHGILELVRTGVIALERGKDTINDDTKVKGEFNYGKNVL